MTRKAEINWEHGEVKGGRRARVRSDFIRGNVTVNGLSFSEGRDCRKLEPNRDFDIRFCYNIEAIGKIPNRPNLVVGASEYKLYIFDKQANAVCELRDLDDDIYLYPDRSFIATDNGHWQYMYHIETGTQLNIDTIPEYIESGLFRANNKLIKWNGRKFEKIDATDDGDDIETSKSEYAGEEIEVPMKDLRELDKTKYENLVSKLITSDEYPYISTEEQAISYLEDGETEWTDKKPSNDMRDELEEELEDDELGILTDD